MVHDTPVIVVPPNLHELLAIMAKDRIRPAREGRVEATRLACCVRWYAYPRKCLISLGVELFEDGRDVEAVDE